MQYLSQNEKMKRSSTVFDLYNWGIPAFLSKDGLKTCPNAKHCVAGCYAKSGAYLFSNVAAKYEQRLGLALSPQFVDTISLDIAKACKTASKRSKSPLIRVHDSGDFFSLDYTLSWFRVMKAFPHVPFYAYTKQVELLKDLKNANTIPDNLTLIYSYGGKQDYLIDPTKDRHSRVFETLEQALKEGYADASHDDTVALGENHRIGLVYHGVKRYDNTAWDKVK
jgi:hypothetical protein